MCFLGIIDPSLLPSRLGLGLSLCWKRGRYGVFVWGLILVYVLIGINFFESQMAAEYVVRVSFGTALIASIVIVYTTIIAIASSSR